MVHLVGNQVQDRVAVTLVSLVILLIMGAFLSRLTSAIFAVGLGNLQLEHISLVQKSSDVIQLCLQGSRVVCFRVTSSSFSSTSMSGNSRPLTVMFVSCKSGDYCSNPTSTSECVMSNYSCLAQK